MIAPLVTAALSAIGVVSAPISPTLPGPPTPEACEAAYVQTQRLRRLEAKLLEAEAQATTCAQPSCPAFVISECTGWLRELEAAIPTLNVVVKDGSLDVSDVTVHVDGRPVASRLDGTPFRLDPGEHVVRVTSGSRSAERKVLLREGERRRNETFQLAPPDASDSTGFGPWPFVFGGVAVSFTIAWAALGIVALDESSTLRDGCGRTRTCAADAVDAAHQKAIASDVMLGLAAASAAATVVSFVLLAPDSDRPTNVSFNAALQPTFLGAWLRVEAP